MCASRMIFAVFEFLMPVEDRFQHVSVSHVLLSLMNVSRH